MTNDITLAPQRQITSDIIDMAKIGGQIMYESRLFGVPTPEAAAAIMLMAHELGFGLTTSFNNFHFIGGKPVLSPKGAMALIHRSGQLVSMKIDRTPDSCTVTMTRRSGVSHTETYTLADAEQAGLIRDGGPWVRQPRNMLQWRAIGNCVNILFPDIIAGLYTADAFGAAVDDNGDVIDGDFTE